MNRKTFLATITALFIAPFIGKSKPTPAPTTITAQDMIDLENSISANYRASISVEEWKKANPAILDGAAVNIAGGYFFPTDPGEEFRRHLSERMADRIHHDLTGNQIK